MIIDLLVILLIISSFFYGRKKGFTLEFFSIIKYLVILVTVEYCYKLVANFLNYQLTNKVKHLQAYIGTFLLLYILISIALKFSEKFLKDIQLKILNRFLGGVLGIVKSTFIIFIIYISILIGSDYNEGIKNQRKQSKIIEKITEYGYIYTKILPSFIREDVIEYRKKMRGEIIKNKLIKEYKENKFEKENKKNENENNR